MKLLADGIYEYENFLSQDQIDAFMDIVNRNPVEGLTLHIESNEFIPLFEPVRNKIYSMFKNLEKMAGLFLVQRWDTNMGMDLHRDDGYGLTENQIGIKWGIVIYLNSEYEGGNIEYPEIDLAFKPKVGSMLIHRGDIPHKVQVVTSGCRYYITGFAYGDDSLEFTP